MVLSARPVLKGRRRRVENGRGAEGITICVEMCRVGDSDIWVLGESREEAVRLLTEGACAHSGGTARQEGGGGCNPLTGGALLADGEQRLWKRVRRSSLA